MTPKEKYDERKRLKADRLLRQEQQFAENALTSDAEIIHQDDAEKMMTNIAMSIERLADVAELWAEQQK